MSLIVAEYRCEEHGVFDVLEPRPAPDAKPCPTCGELAAWCISAPRVKVPITTAGTRGRYEPPPRGYMDTRALGEGQDLDEWKADRAKAQHAERMREAKEVMGG